MIALDTETIKSVKQRISKVFNVQNVTLLIRGKALQDDRLVQHLKESTVITVVEKEVQKPKATIPEVLGKNDAFWKEIRSTIEKHASELDPQEQKKVLNSFVRAVLL